MHECTAPLLTGPYFGNRQPRRCCTSPQSSLYPSEPRTPRRAAVRRLCHEAILRILVVLPVQPLLFATLNVPAVHSVTEANLMNGLQLHVG